MALAKPKHCGQNWQEMKPTEGGRICAKCENTIIDFTKMSWNQIEMIQENNGNSVCGMYNKKQLDNWGRESEIKDFSVGYLFAASSVLLTLSQFNGSEAMAQSLIQTEMNQSSFNIASIESQPQDSIEIITIEGTVRHRFNNGSSEIMPYAKVFLENSNHFSKADVNGNYCITIEKQIDSIRNENLILRYVGYVTKTFPLSSFNSGSRFDIELNDEDQESSGFYVVEVSTPKKIGARIKGWFNKK